MNATVPVERTRAASLDYIGMIASMACGVHCIAGSLIVASAGVFSLFANERVELGLVSVAVAIAALSIGSGVRRHRALWPLACLLTAIAVLSLARIVEQEELTFSIAGAALLVAAHGSNLRALQHWRCCC